jgi:mannose-6-phosphate isomerase
MNDSALYPWRLEPKLTSAVWGGPELVRDYGKRGAANAKLGESWECWDDDKVLNGPLHGTTLATLRTQLGARFLGNLDPGRIFPVLAKIITANDWLSVQVHPNDAYARRVEHQPNGKTECWYVMAAEPGAELVVGWNRDTSRDEYERRVGDGTLAEILRKVPVCQGDTVYVPAGLVHAIGPGVTVYETQQASDLTYRLFDWNRNGADGKPRELHVRKAGDVLDYRAGRHATLSQIEYVYAGLARTALIADPRFCVERAVATATPATIETGARPLVVTSLGEAMQVECGGTTAALEKFRTVVVPAGAETCTVRAGGNDAPFMLVTAPDAPDQLATRMLAAGIERRRVDAFAAQFG